MLIRQTRANGFSLIELLIVIAIIGILAAFAYPSYQSHVETTRRSDARSTLIQLSSAMERYFSDQSTYVGADAMLNPGTSENSHYAITVTEDVLTYSLSATPTGAQSGDDCGTYTLNSLGSKGAGLSFDQCW